MTSDFAGRPEGFYRTLGPGSRIAGYLVGEQVGAGGMAVVFRARDEVLGRLAAVKVIAPSMANDQEFRARFLRESRMAAAVDSLHIIPVYAAGEAEGLLYIATRFVAGGDLAGLLLRSGGRLEPGRAASLVAQVASALDAAHAAGLVHRDVKPQNILVDTVPEQPEHAFLTDFGLSKWTQSSARLTADGQFLGTPDYSAPEQVRGGHVDARADQYGLACVAYVLLTGELPFSRSDTMATMFAHLQEAVPLVTRARPELSPAVNGVIARALAKSPADRYPRCADFAAALREAVALPRLAAGPDAWAWLAKDGRATRVPAAGRPRRPPSAAGFAVAISENARYARPDSGGNAGPGRAQEPALGGQGPKAKGQGPTVGGQGSRLRGRRFQVALIGGAAAVLALAGVLYAISQPGRSPASVEHAGKPALAATLTVPGDNTVDSAWTSPDGKLIAASGQGRSIYVWNAASRSYVTTLTAPNIRIGTTIYSAVIDNISFSADDSSLTAALYPNVPSGAPTPGSQSAYAVYRWNLAAGKPTLIWSVAVPATVAFSNDNSTALTSRGNVVSLVTLAPELNTAPSVTLPGGAEQSYPPPYELDLDGDRMIYHPASDETYVWDFTRQGVVARLRSSEYTVLSPDGKTILAADPSNYPAPAGGRSAAAPSLWDVATQSNVTPADPRWKQQLREPWETYSWQTYSEDGSVIMTRRAGGKIDLWSAATRKCLLTITEPDYRKDGFATAAASGSEVVILTTEKSVSGRDEYRQLDLWETPLS